MGTMNMMQNRNRRRVLGALSIADLRDLSRKKLPRSVFDYIDGGAGDEITLKENIKAFENTKLLPRVLVDVSQPNLSVSIFGKALSTPFIVAPMGSCALAWPNADLAIARAACKLGIPYTLSTMATISLEQMARTVDGRLWFQLYVLRDEQLTYKLVARAKAAEFEALVVTVDLPAAGKRERDLRNGISVPIRFGLRQLLDGMAHPDWAVRMMFGGLPQFENVRGMLGEGAGLTIAARVGKNLDSSFSWEDLRKLRDFWPRKLIVKGVLNAGDADRLVAIGVDGIWISNHGGRQLDGAISSLEALPRIASVVQRKIPLLLDSGVRRGGDALKALALGASGVAVGRAALFGAAVGGQDGAEHALKILIDELTLSMRLSGVQSFQDTEKSLGNLIAKEGGLEVK